VSTGQIVALVFAILLLLPGGCFTLLGFGLASEPYYVDGAVIVFVIAAGIFGIAGLLFWVAFRRQRPPAPPAS
jgi:hypothetical protein